MKRCLESVAFQTYTNVEHIVIDGGSSDGTLELLRGSKEIKWISEPDQGQTSAINKGFDIAQGDILTWLNADDVLEQRSIEMAVDALHANPDVGWVYGNLEVVEASLRKVVKPPSRLSWSILSAGNRVNQPGTYFTRGALQKVGGLDESFDLTMDFDLWLRFLAAGVKSHYVNEVLASFEVHEASKTGRVSLVKFAEEEAKAFLKHGRVAEAAVAYGRAAAYSVTSSEGTNSRLLRQAVELYTEKAPQEAKLAKIIRASAYAQAAIEDLKFSMAGVRHLLHLDPWLVAPARRRLFATLTRAKAFYLANSEK